MVHVIKSSELSPLFVCTGRSLSTRLHYSHILPSLYSKYKVTCSLAGFIDVIGY